MTSKKLLAILIISLTSGVTLAHADDALPTAAPLGASAPLGSGSLFSGPYAGFKVGANGIAVETDDASNLVSIKRPVRATEHAQ